MLAVVLVVAFALLALGAAIKLLRKEAEGLQQHEEAPQEVQAAPGARGVNRMQAGMRRRRAGGRAAARGSDEEGSEDDEGAGGRRGGQQAEEAAAQEARQKKRDAYDAKRAAKDAEREAQEAAQEEEIRRAAEERQRREEAEAAKWMHLFTVEAAGEDALSVEQGEALAARFVEHIKTRKTVPLDELAAEFGMKTADAIARLQALEAEGRITGVMDDRGKFIYISPEEMAAVAEFIRQRGRIAIAELAQRSNAFIDLSSREVAVEGELELPPIEAAA